MLWVNIVSHKRAAVLCNQCLLWVLDVTEVRPDPRDSLIRKQRTTVINEPKVIYDIYVYTSNYIYKLQYRWNTGTLIIKGTKLQHTNTSY